MGSVVQRPWAHSFSTLGAECAEYLPPYFGSDGSRSFFPFPFRYLSPFTSACVASHVSQPSLPPSPTPIFISGRATLSFCLRVKGFHHFCSLGVGWRKQRGRELKKDRFILQNMTPPHNQLLLWALKGKRRRKQGTIENNKRSHF